MEDANKAVIDFEKYLNVGEENAIKCSDLARFMGISTRQLQFEIHDARIAGQIILSGNNGYYLPGNDEEVQRFVNMLNAKAINTLAILKSSRIYLKQDKQQLNMNI